MDVGGSRRRSSDAAALASCPRSCYNGAPGARRQQETRVPNPSPRIASVTRATRETRIAGTVNLDGSGAYDIATGIGFLDHMLEQLSRHSLIDVRLAAQGDLHIDFHHTTEDTGYVIGEAVAKALGERRGIVRYGHAVIPMDETLTRVTVDVSNR